MSATGPFVQSLFTTWLSGKTVKAMLLTSSYTQNPDTGSLPTSFEVSGTGYTAGGVTITGSLSVTYDTSANVARLLCSDIAFGTVELADVGAIAIYAGTLLIAADVFSPVVVSASPFTYRPATTGLVIGTIG